MFLKDQFSEVFSVFDEDVKFCSVCWYGDRKLGSGLPRVVDTIFFIPKRYFGLRKTFRSQIWRSGHCILDFWNNAYKLDYSFYLSTYHDANSFSDWNPLYRIACRSECQEVVSGTDLLYPRDF